MKSIYLLLFTLICSMSEAQIINIPDANFKAKLVEANLTNGLAKDSEGNNIVIDINANGEIEVSEAVTVGQLFYTPPPPFRLNGNSNNVSFQDYDISDLTGIEYFTNLKKLDVSQNNLVTLNLTALTQLDYLSCSGNLLTSINVSGLANLQVLEVAGNQLSALNLNGLNALSSLNCGTNQLGILDISNLANLNRLSCYSNQLTQLICANNSSLERVSCSGNLFTELDFSNTAAQIIDCYNNPNLTFLNIKNGYGTPVYYENPPLLMQFPGLTVPATLGYICHDEFELNGMAAYMLQIQNISRGTYCSFEPGGSYNTVTGIISFDCNNANTNIGNQVIGVASGSTTGYTTSGTNGNYVFYTGLGNTVITPQFSFDYFTVSPPNYTFDYTNLGNTSTANFCLEAVGVHPDVEVTLYPITPARPGFDAKYKIVYRNKGNQLQSGSVNVAFEDDLLDFVTATPATNSLSTNNLTWDFSNLIPFEIREILFTLNVNAPTDTPAVNNGDILNYSVALSTAMTDETPADNEMGFNQTVVGSFDPNDKTVVEGSQISIASIGNYLHYIVRFQNTGTYPAENVVIKDLLSSNLDWSTLEIVSSSHPFRNTLTSNNNLQVFYENINLPSSSTDEPGSHGYIAFRIKPESTVVVDDVISNTAEIYFDFNFPIITNTVATTVTALGTGDFESHLFTLYPNPTDSLLHLQLANADRVKDVVIYNTLGQKILSQSGATSIDVSLLSQGTYLITVETETGKTSRQFVKL